jgi:hypothetical protein
MWFRLPGISPGGGPRRAKVVPDAERSDAFVVTVGMASNDSAVPSGRLRRPSDLWRRHFTAPPRARLWATSGLPAVPAVSPNPSHQRRTSADDLVSSQSLSKSGIPLTWRFGCATQCTSPHGSRRCNAGRSCPSPKGPGTPDGGSSLPEGPCATLGAATGRTGGHARFRVGSLAREGAVPGRGMLSVTRTVRPATFG